MRNSHGQRNSKKVNWENMGGQDPNMTNGTTFHLGKDGQIRNSQGQVIDLRDSRDFGKTKPNNHGKRTHISNQQMLNNFKDSRKKRKSKGDNLPLK